MVATKSRANRNEKKNRIKVSMRKESWQPIKLSTASFPGNVQTAPRLDDQNSGSIAAVVPEEVSLRLLRIATYLANRLLRPTVSRVPWSFKSVGSG